MPSPTKSNTSTYPNTYAEPKRAMKVASFMVNVVGLKSRECVQALHWLTSSMFVAWS